MTPPRLEPLMPREEPDHPQSLSWERSAPHEQPREEDVENRHRWRVVSGMIGSRPRGRSATRLRLDAATLSRRGEELAR